MVQSGISLIVEKPACQEPTHAGAEIESEDIDGDETESLLALEAIPTWDVREGADCIHVASDSESAHDVVREPEKKRKRMRGKTTPADRIPRPRPGKVANAAAQCGLPVDAFKTLQRMGWPFAMFNLLAFVMGSLGGATDGFLQVVENYSGFGRIASVSEQME